MAKYTIHSTYRGIGAQTMNFDGVHQFISDEPVSSRGTDAGPNPVQYLLGAVGGCLGATAAWAERKNKQAHIDKFEVTVTGETVVLPDHSSKVNNIQIKIDCQTNLNKEEQDKFVEEIIHNCTVHTTLENGVETAIEIVPKAQENV